LNKTFAIEEKREALNDVVETGGKKFYVVLFILCIQCVHAQMVFTRQVGTNSNFLSVSGGIGEESYLIYNLNYTVNPQYQTKSQLLKISPSGLLLDSLNFNNDFFISSAIISVGNFYYCYGTQMINTGLNIQRYSSVLMKINQNLDVVKQVVIDTTDNEIILDHKIISTGNCLYIGNCRPSSTKINLYRTSFNLVKEDSIRFIGSSLLDLSKYGRKILVSGWGLSFGSAFGNSQVLEVDSNFAFVSRFNLDSVTTLNPGCEQQIGINGLRANIYDISDNKYIVVGLFPVVFSGSCITKFQNITSVIKHNNKVIKTNVIGNPIKDNIISVGHVNQNNRNGHIYTVAESGYDLQNTLAPQTNTTQILLHKIDTMGNLIWVKYFSEPDFFYRPYSVFATPDSGSVVCGMRYNLLNPVVNGACEGFVMKIDKAGNQVFVGIKENNGRFSTQKCYPNPSADQVFFDIPFQDKIDIVVYSAHGAEVLNTKDYKNRSAINVSGLEKGIYFYKVKTTTNNYSGKFLKE
jgi:hypothetical protein